MPPKANGSQQKSNQHTLQDFNPQTEAIENLVRLVCSGVQNMSLMSSAPTSNLDKETFIAKSDAILHGIKELNKSILEVNKSVRQLSKRQTLQWAISNANTNSFTYYTPENNRNGQDTAGLVRAILLAFLQGETYYVEEEKSTIACVYGNSWDVDASKREEGEEDFQRDLLDQIHELTGVKPKLKWDDKGEGYTLRYS